MSNNQKQQVVALLKSIETGESQPMSVINPQYYTQHNLGAADGLAGVEALVTTPATTLCQGSDHASLPRWSVCVHAHGL